jgi:hypothetical protein
MLRDACLHGVQARAENSALNKEVEKLCHAVAILESKVPPPPIYCV